MPNATAHSLAGSNFSQDWSNTGLITTNNDWSNVPSIVGYRGEGLTSAIGADPQTLIADITSSVYVLANRTNPNLTTGGVGEFQLSNPVIALQGSGTADAPNIVLNLDATGRKNLTVSYILRDIDGSVNNAVSPVALQYRVGSSGFWTNVATKFVADASQGGQAGLETFVSTVLPSAVNNQGLVQIRVITSNAAGYDEWIGIDDISVTSASSAPPIAVNDDYSTIHNQPLTVSGSGLLGNDTATGGATTLTATPQTNVATAHGFVTVQSNGGFTYTPNAGYVGADSFGYQVNDNFGNSSKATATINVTNANPTAQDITAVTERGVAVTGNVLENSNDADNDILSAIAQNFTTSLGNHVEINSDGSFTLTPPNGFYGADSFNFTVVDPFGSTSIGTVNFSVTIPISIIPQSYQGDQTFNTLANSLFDHNLQSRVDLLSKVSEFWLYVMNSDYYVQLAETSLVLDTNLRNLLAEHADNEFIAGLLTDLIDANANVRQDFLSLSGDAARQALEAWIQLYDLYTESFLGSLSLDADMIDFLNQFDLYFFPKQQQLQQFNLLEYFEEYLLNKKELTEL